MSDPLLALWTPAWHELDQTLAVGSRQRYFFFKTADEALTRNQPDVKLVFFNQVDITRNCEIRFARVTSIRHAELGELLRVDTFGLDYILYPLDGAEVVIDAEEQPGRILDTERQIKNWDLAVTLEEVSEPVADFDT